VIRERVLKIVLLIAGLIFLGGIYPIAIYLWRPGNASPGDAMMFSLYVTMGVFLLVAVRNPAAYRSLISYAGWANIVHATVMALMAINPASDRKGLIMATAGFGVIGAALLVLVPARHPRQGIPEGFTQNPG
jgi:Family of unknown function (DUF6632)